MAKNLNKMKTFITREVERNFIQIYRVKNNEPIYVGFANYQNRSHKGVINEVAAALVECEELPKNILDKSGYITAQGRESFNLFEIL